MNYSQLLDVECPFPAICAAARVPENSKFGDVLLALLGLAAANATAGPRPVAVHVSFDRDAHGSGMREDGRTPLTDAELRDVLLAKKRTQEMALAETSRRLADLDAPKSVDTNTCLPPAVN